MPQKVNISTATTGVETTPNLAGPQALSNIGDAIGDVASVATKFAAREKAEREQLALKAENALNKFQFSSNNAVLTDSWGELNATNKHNLNEDVVFSSIEEQYAAQDALIENAPELTSVARAALREANTANKSASYNNYRNNLSNAKANAAATAFDQQLTYSIAKGSEEDASIAIMEAENAGIITQEAGDALFSDATIKIDMQNIEKDIYAVEYGDYKEEGKTSQELLTGVAQDIKSRDNLDVDKKNALLNQVSDAKSRNLAGQGQLMKQADLFIASNNYVSASALVNDIEDPDVRLTYKLRLNLDANAFEEITKAAKAKAAKADATAADKAEAARLEAASKARAAEAKLLVAENTERKYSKFDPTGKKTADTYDMTPNEHLQKLKFGMHNLYSGRPIQDINQPKTKYTGDTALRYLEREIAAISNTEHREQMQAQLLEVMSNPETNSGLYDVDLYDVDVSETYDKKGWIFTNKAVVYPRTVREPIASFQSSFNDLLIPAGLNPDEANLELITAFNNGLESILYASNNDKDSFRRDPSIYVKGALKDAQFIINRMKVEKSVGPKPQIKVDKGDSSNVRVWGQ